MSKLQHEIQYILQKPQRLLALGLFGIVAGAVTILLLAFSSPSKQAPSQEILLPQYTVKRTVGEVKIDGVLSEESWTKAAPVGDFSLTDGSGKPQVSTSAKLLWDSTTLYIAFECSDTDIIARMTQRDDKLWEEEVVEVFFAPYLPEKFGYTELEISPANTILDLYVREVRGVMPIALPYTTYNLNVRSATQIRGTLNNSTDRDTSWTVEISLPLADVQPVNLLPITEGDKWRMNFYRMERFPNKEFIAWSPTMLNKFHVPARFGEVIFSMKRAGE
ncbi:MAG: carbohydrate-binding family 9-like protein [Candidatus Kapabacteria bacterium]|jgi:hypothetical protein|nr:carbohydrate-binding family 9-like protein [Candidatus Kapabacteria bacterium]